MCIWVVPKQPPQTCKHFNYAVFQHTVARLSAPRSAEPKSKLILNFNERGQESARPLAPE